MNRKTLATSALIALVVAVMLISVPPAQACYREEDGIDGYVLYNGEPKSGLTVQVYISSTDDLEGYKFGYKDDPEWLGTDITDEDGYFHIAYLYANGKTYRVEVETECGTLSKEVTVNCGSTVRVDFSCFEPRTVGYWKNHPEEWPVGQIKIGGITYTTEKAIEEILKISPKGDATYILAKQLVAAKLNLLSGSPMTFEYEGTTYDMTEIVNDADGFLTSHPLGTKPKGPDRDYALWLKDILDAYNNSGSE